MRYMIIVKATRGSEAGVMPEEKLIAEMATYHEELAKAGMLVDASGPHPSSKGCASGTKATSARSSTVRSPRRRNRWRGPTWSRRVI